MRKTLASVVGSLLGITKPVPRAEPKGGVTFHFIPMNHLGSYLDGRRVRGNVTAYVTGFNRGRPYSSGLNGERAVARRLKQIEAGSLRVQNGLCEFGWVGQ